MADLEFVKKIKAHSKRSLLSEMNKDGSIEIVPHEILQLQRIASDISNLKYLSRHKPELLNSFLLGLRLRAKWDAREIVFFEPKKVRFIIKENIDGSFLCKNEVGEERVFSTPEQIADMVDNSVESILKRYKSAKKNFDVFKEETETLIKLFKQDVEFRDLIDYLEIALKRLGCTFVRTINSRISESVYFAVVNGDSKHKIRVSMHKEKDRGGHVDLSILVRFPCDKEDVLKEIIDFVLESQRIAA